MGSRLKVETPSPKSHMKPEKKESTKQRQSPIKHFFAHSTEGKHACQTHAFHASRKPMKKKRPPIETCGILMQSSWQLWRPRVFGSKEGRKGLPYWSKAFFFDFGLSIFRKCLGFLCIDFEENPCTLARFFF